MRVRCSASARALNVCDAHASSLRLSPAFVALLKHHHGQVQKQRFSVINNDDAHHNQLILLDAFQRLGFLHHDSKFAPGECFVVGQERTLRFASAMLRTDCPHQRWGIDKTFKCGDFFVTSVTLRVPFLSRGKASNMGVLFMVHRQHGDRKTWKILFDILETKLMSFAPRAAINKKLIVMDREFEHVETKIFVKALCCNHLLQGIATQCAFID